jgi:hypothetical protein
LGGIALFKEDLIAALSKSKLAPQSKMKLKIKLR